METRKPLDLVDQLESALKRCDTIPVDAQLLGEANESIRELRMLVGPVSSIQRPLTLIDKCIDHLRIDEANDPSHEFAVMHQRAALIACQSLKVLIHLEQH